MQIRPLRPDDFPIVHAAFLEAFSDYAVPFQLTAEQLGEMLRRRGYEAAASVGVFDEGRLVAFTLNGVGEWNGVRTGYDTGTGVVPSHRGRGLSGTMIDASIETLQAHGARQYLLEVLQSNERAFRVYRQAGFEVVRELQCWQLETASSKDESGVTRVDSLDDSDWDRVASFFDAAPSWQNTIDSVRRAGATRSIHCVRSDDGLIGCAVVFESGDLPLVAVAHSARRRGLGKRLLAATHIRPLRILNVDASLHAAAGFLEACGAVKTLAQFEMLRPIGG